MLLEVEDLHIAYGDIRAVSGVDFHIAKGELVSIIGANGAGKTSILSAVMGTITAHRGKIRFGGEDLTTHKAFQRARLGIRMVPERARVFPRLSVYENLMVGVYHMHHRIDLTGRLSWLYGLFPVLEKRSDQAAATMSGGEQQQLAIARALISDPQLLLVDEISMGLMPKLVDEVFDLLERLNRESGLTILLVEQNAVASLDISRRAYVLETGRIVHQGPARQLADDPRVKAVYLGH